MFVSNMSIIISITSISQIAYPFGYVIPFFLNFLRCFTKKPPFRWSLGFLFLRNLRFVHLDQQGRRVPKKYAFNTNYRPCGTSHTQVFQRTNLGIFLVNARAEPSTVVPSGKWSLLHVRVSRTSTCQSPCLVGGSYISVISLLRSSRFGHCS